MKNVKEVVDSLMDEVGKVVVGQKDVLEEVLVAVLCDGNALLEGYPGLAKTLAIKSLAEAMDMKFSRIQNTPDLMPSDITGTEILEETDDGKRKFRFQPGPIFANIVLADEINRATPKTQSALLEAMQEKQVTVGNKTYALDLPFFVLATQNPIEQEGTYPLPEAQADRFLLKIKVGYPSLQEEAEIVDRYSSSRKSASIKKGIDKNKVNYLQDLVKQVPIAKDLKMKALKIVNATRDHELIQFGASPRASIGLVLAAKAYSLIKGRSYVSTEDIHKMAYPVLRHRIVVSFDAERKGITPDEAIKAILDKVK
ncbi:MoxR family ATPase [Candidatus Woesearchaeota archaeon]|nr:MoxR family ATPase [Candidatus Woesearchaeota archaeon]